MVRKSKKTNPERSGRSKSWQTSPSVFSHEAIRGFLFKSGAPRSQELLGAVSLSVKDGAFWKIRVIRPLQQNQQHSSWLRYSALT